MAGRGGRGAHRRPPASPPSCRWWRFRCCWRCDPQSARTCRRRAARPSPNRSLLGAGTGFEGRQQGRPTGRPVHGRKCKLQPLTCEPASLHVRTQVIAACQSSTQLLCHCNSVQNRPDSNVQARGDLDRGLAMCSRGSHQKRSLRCDALNRSVPQVRLPAVRTLAGS
jgi:hypothetical protein